MVSTLFAEMFACSYSNPPLLIIALEGGRIPLALAVFQCNSAALRVAYGLIAFFVCVVFGFMSLSSHRDVVCLVFGILYI